MIYKFPYCFHFITYLFFLFQYLSIIYSTFPASKISLNLGIILLNATHLLWIYLSHCTHKNKLSLPKSHSPHMGCCCCCCRPHSTNVLPAESSTRNHVAASSLSPKVARKGSTLSGFIQRSRLEREVGRDLHSNKWEEV